MFIWWFLVALALHQKSSSENYEIYTKLLYDEIYDEVKEEIMNQWLDKQTTFENNKACADSYDNIWAEINQPHLIRNTLDPVVDEVFYSPVDNECMYVFRALKSELCLQDNLPLDMARDCLWKDKHLFSYSSKQSIGSMMDLDNKKSDCYDRAESFNDTKTDIMKAQNRCEEIYDFDNVVAAKKWLEIEPFYYIPESIFENLNST